MSLLTYPQHKGSTTDWLGNVPAHWEVIRLKNLLSEIDTRAGEQSLELLGLSKSQGVRKRKELDQNAADSDDYGKYKVVKRGELVMNRMQAWNGVFGVSPYNGIVSPDYATFRFIRPGLASFLSYLLRTELMAGEFFTRCRGMGTAFLRINSGDFLDVKVAVPPAFEAAAIGNFLDRETAKIDALIVEQEKLLALLAEKRQATISHAVTRGLDPHVSMKDSGIAWLGEVPVHWEVVMLRRVVERFEQGWSPECDSRPAEVGEWGVLKAGCVNGGVFAPGEHKTLPPTLAARPELEISSGDVLMSRASGSPKLIGSVAVVDNPPARLMLSDKIFRIELADHVLGKFFALAMGSTPLRQQIEQAIGGAEGLANNLSQSSIKELWVALPPEPEQRQILAHVEAELQALRKLGNAAERAITLLKERRSALITATVTGQIDVRDVPRGVVAA